MKVKNIAFSGFMASILMAGAAYAADTPTLATDQYVIQGVNYAISQAAADATSKVGTAVTNITNGTTIAAKATGDAAGNEISTTYLKSADAADTYETKGTAAGLVGTLPSNKATVVAYIEGESAAAEAAIGDLDGRLDTLEATVAGIESYDDSALAGRVTTIENSAAYKSGITGTLVSQISTNQNNITALTNVVNDATTGLSTKQAALTPAQLAAVNSGITEDDVSAIESNTLAIGANVSAIAGLDAGKQDNLDPDQLAAVNSGIDADRVGKYDAYNTTLTELVADITELDSKKQDALPTTTGNTGKVLKVGANGLEWATDANSQYDDSALAGRVTTAEGKIETLENAGYITKDVEDLTNYTTTSSMNSAIANAVSGEETRAKGVEEDLDSRLTTAEGNITALDNDKADKADTYSAIEVDSLLSAKADTDDLADVATSGSYSDLIGAPAKVSDLNNDAGYITKNVTDLTNYTTTTDMNAALTLKANAATTYTKTEVDTALGALTCDDNKYCLIVGNTAVPYDLAITNENW